MVRPSNLTESVNWTQTYICRNTLNVVHGSDGSLGISLLAITDESETTATASVTVLDDDLDDCMSVLHLKLIKVT